MRQHAPIHDQGKRGPDEAAEAATEVGAEDLDEIEDAYAFEQVTQTLLCAVAIVALVAAFAVLT